MDAGRVSLQRLLEDAAQLLLREPGAPPGPDGFSHGAGDGFAAICALLLFGDLRYDGPHALPGPDEALALQVLVGPPRGDDAAREIARQRPHGGEPRARLETAGEDEFPQLRFDLPVHRLGVVHREVQGDTRPRRLGAHAEKSLFRSRRTVTRARTAKAAPPARTEKTASRAPLPPCASSAVLLTRSRSRVH